MLTWLRRTWRWQRIHEAAWAGMAQAQADGLSRFQAECWRALETAMTRAGRAVPTPIPRASDPGPLLTGRLADGRAFLIAADGAIVGGKPFRKSAFRFPQQLWGAFVAEALGPVTPEEADRIAADHFAHQGWGAAYRAARVAELPELQKFYYVPKWNLTQARTHEDELLVPIGGGGCFVCLRTGEAKDPGSGAAVTAWHYLRMRDRLPPDGEPSYQEFAELLARHSGAELNAMCRWLERGWHEDPH